MRIGNWCVERTGEVWREVGLPRVVVTYERPARTVLWGGHPGRDVWVGSREDRVRERYRRMTAPMIRFQLTVRDQLTPALQRADERLRALALSVRASREW